MFKSISSIIVWALFYSFAHAQVLDVNNDDTVGAEEALAVAESWKGEPTVPNDHNHLGQTWRGNRNPLTIRGNFPPNLVIGPLKSGRKGFSMSPSAPLILDNTATRTNGYHHPDLILRGTIGMISAEQHSGSELHLVANSNVFVWLDSDSDSLHPTFTVLNGDRAPVASISEDGDMGISGVLSMAGSKQKIDHPLDPSGKYLQHAYVGSPDQKCVYDGVATLDEQGVAWVYLPEYFGVLNRDLRYQMTPIGASAPNLFIAEEIRDNRFKIAGCVPGMRVSWQVTGIRRDLHSKANPLEVEKVKSDKDIGMYLHPELFDEPLEKRVGFVASESGKPIGGE